MSVDHCKLEHLMRHLSVPSLQLLLVVSGLFVRPPPLVLMSIWLQEMCLCADVFTSNHFLNSASRPTSTSAAMYCSEGVYYNLTNQMVCYTQPSGEYFLSIVENGQAFFKKCLRDWMKHVSAQAIRLLLAVLFVCLEKFAVALKLLTRRKLNRFC